MRFLRTVSTQRLLATLAGVVIAVAGGTAIAVAASSGGPVPRPAKLAQAVHSALAAPTVPGVSARITFTNHLIAASNIQGSDPLLQGGSGRLWLSPSTHQLRLELQSDNGDAQAVVSGGRFWVYDPGSNTVYAGTLPAGAVSEHSSAKHEALPTVSQIQSEVNKLAQHMSVSGAIPSDVAGHAAYTVQVAPKHDGGLLGDAQLAWDAARGVPLRFAVYARGDGSPVLELKATQISFGQVPTSDFALKPPKNAKVVKVSTPATPTHSARHSERQKKTGVSGAAAVQRHLHFKLVAPKTLVGLPRQSVTLLDWAGTPAALVTYGQNLGGIAVVEQDGSRAHGLPSGTSSSSNGDQGRGLSLPTVSIDGATGHELDTALGTVLTFSRGNVSYTVLGSVPPAAAEAAARAL
jgi:outer membrane lipoprotein-sorting protein